MVTTLEPRLEKAGLDYDTVEERKRNTGRSFDDVNEFLTLISFIALLLGCIGVASAIHIYMREKISSIAILRCLGVNSSQAFLIYLIQIIGIGIIGSILGALVGTLIQQVLPTVLKDFLPIQINAGISWPSVGKGIALGAVIAALFGLLPLLSVRNVSPCILCVYLSSPPAFSAIPSNGSCTSSSLLSSSCLPGGRYTVGYRPLYLP